MNPLLFRASAVAVIPLIIALTFVPACGGQALDGGTGTSRDGGSSSGGSSSGGSSSGGSSSGGSPDMSAQCNGPRGELERPETAASYARALVGRWFSCNYWNGSPFPFTSHQAIEILDDGHWFGLNPDGNGGFVRDLSLKGYGTYAIYSGTVDALVPNSDTTVSGAKRLWMHLNEIILDVRIDFEVNPRRFHTFSGADLWFVRTDPGPTEPTPYQGKDGEYCDNLFPCASGLNCNDFSTKDYAVPGGHLQACTK